MEYPEYTQDIDFQKYWLVLKRHWLPSSSIFGLIIALATAYAATREPTYEAQGKLLIKKRNTTSALITEAGAKLGELDSLTQLNNPLDTEAEIVKSIPISEKAIEELSLKDSAGNPLDPQSLIRGLSVKGIKGTDVLEVTYSSGDPQKAAAVVNQVMAAYMENNIAANRSEAAAAREFINRQLPQTEATLREAESALRSFKEQNNIVALEEEAKSAVQVIANLDTALNRTQAELADAATRTSVIQEKIGLNSQQAITLNALSQSPAVQEVLTQLQAVQDELTLQRSSYQEKHPIITSLKRKQQGLQALLQERIGQVVGSQDVPSQNLQIGDLQQALLADLVNAEVQRLGLANQVEYLSGAQIAYQERVNVLPRLQEGLRVLERKVNAAQATYEILLKNLQEVEIAENQNVGNARILATALVPQAPVGPNKKVFLIAGIVVGSMLYIITAFLLELLEPSIKTAKEVRSVFKYTLLGLIPQYRKKGFFFPKWNVNAAIPALPVLTNPHSVISESYRMLQANLRFLSPDKDLKVIVVTSSVSKEGKSTVSANLAVAMAQLGRQVLLIDGDLRHPLQHHIWDLTNAAGLSDVIVRQADANMAITEVMDNLDVLTSGAIPPNPLALLDSKRMASLVKEFSKDYNFIIIDTPPLLLAADALTLGKITDGILLVIRPGVIDTASTAAAKEILGHSGLDVLGMVINGVVVENEPDSYFHHAKAYHKQDLMPAKLPRLNTPTPSDFSLTNKDR